MKRSAVVLVVLIALAGCGGGSSVKAGPAAKASPTTAQASPTRGQGVDQRTGERVDCPTQALKVSAATPWAKVKDAYEADEWAATIAITNPNATPVVIDNSTAVISYTGGRVPEAITGKFAAIAGPENTPNFHPVIGPNQSVTVTLQAVAGQKVTAITTSDLYATAYFTFRDRSCPPVVLDGAKPFEEAPRPQARTDPEPGHLPSCGAGGGPLLCT